MELPPKKQDYGGNVARRCLVIEAEKKSGTLITPRLAGDATATSRPVPGSIFSKNSEGPHMLIRLGATPATSSREILEALGFKTDEKPDQEKLFADCSREELLIAGLLKSPLPRDEIIRQMGLAARRSERLAFGNGNKRNRFGVARRIPAGVI